MRLSILRKHAFILSAAYLQLHLTKNMALPATNPCNESGCYYPTIEICSTPLLKDREYCFHEPPLEMSIKIVGKLF